MEAAIETLKQATRNYAKRQLTWVPPRRARALGSGAGAHRGGNRGRNSKRYRGETMTNIHIPEIPTSVAALIQRAEADCSRRLRVWKPLSASTRAASFAPFRNTVWARDTLRPRLATATTISGAIRFQSYFPLSSKRRMHLVRPQIASGTHALALCLYGVLQAWR